MSDEKLAERATAYIAEQRAQFTDGFSAIHTAHLRLQAALDVAIEERTEARSEVERLREALQVCACTCLAIRECASAWSQDGHCPHFVARRALEAKP